MSRIIDRGSLSLVETYATASHKAENREYQRGEELPTDLDGRANESKQEEEKPTAVETIYCMLFRLSTSIQ